MSPRSRPVLPAHAISRVDRRGIHGWRIHIKRGGQDHLGLTHDHKCGGRASALRAAERWYYEALRLLPPPLCTSTRDVRSTTGKVGVSLEQIARPDGNVYSCYRAVWPLGQGRYRKRAFSLAKYGKRAAFKLAVRARQEGLAQFAKTLRDRVNDGIETRSARRRRSTRR